MSGIPENNMERADLGVSPIEALLVDDNAAYARLIAEALKERKIPARLHVVPDGAEAMAFLRGESRDAGLRLPDIILLDINLPQKSGLEVLKDIKSDDRLGHIPVVILTVSESEADVMEAYKNHANCYITKPMGLQQFMHVTESLWTFWTDIARLPSRAASKSRL